MCGTRRAAHFFWREGGAHASRAEAGEGAAGALGNPGRFSLTSRRALI